MKDIIFNRANCSLARSITPWPAPHNPPHGAYTPPPHRSPLILYCIWNRCHNLCSRQRLYDGGTFLSFCPSPSCSTTLLPLLVLIHPSAPPRPAPPVYPVPSWFTLLPCLFLLPSPFLALHHCSAPLRPVSPFCPASSCSLRTPRPAPSSVSCTTHPREIPHPLMAYKTIFFNVLYMLTNKVLHLWPCIIVLPSWTQPWPMSASLLLGYSHWSSSFTKLYLTQFKVTKWLDKEKATRK